MKYTYLLTYLLTPWSRVLLEKLTGSAASQEIPRIFGTRRFITVLTSARHLSLSWANSIQSSQPPPTSWRSVLSEPALYRLLTLFMKYTLSQKTLYVSLPSSSSSTPQPTTIITITTARHTVHKHRRFKITLPNTDQAQEEYLWTTKSTFSQAQHSTPWWWIAHDPKHVGVIFNCLWKLTQRRF